MHVRQGWETVCVVPPSGLVTAIEPVLRACDGVWVAHGSGSEDPVVVDEFDRLRVPPDDPRYTLRRVWLSSEEESGYYDGFANEGLWPLCHIAHTRPIFRESDWECYQRVNEKFAAALLEEMERLRQSHRLCAGLSLRAVAAPHQSGAPGCARGHLLAYSRGPIRRPSAFAHGRRKLLDGLLGADLIGFHIPIALQQFSRHRGPRARSAHRPGTHDRSAPGAPERGAPLSGERCPGQSPGWSDRDWSSRRSRPLARQALLDEFDVNCETLALGVDRLDYTKGIVERLLAIEQLFEEHPWHLERLTMVQIAAPSRTRIPSYMDLRRQVERDCGAHQPALPDCLLETDRAHRAAMQPRRGRALVSRCGPLPGHIAARRHEPGSQGIRGGAPR
jgi:hypothetical protein